MVAQTHFDFVKESGGIKSYRHRKNGLEVLLLKQAVAPVATVMITYRVGSRNEVNGTTGATHLLEHLMFKGTDRFNSESGTSVFNVLQGVGAQINATTWLDRTNYYAILQTADISLALDIEADRMRNARISEDDLLTERSVVLNEYDRGENEPLRALQHAVWSTAFIAHSYRHPTIGWRSDIETVTAAELRQFYDTFYYPNNATLSIIGDYPEETILSEIDRFFGSIGPSSEPFPTVKTMEPEQLGERCVTLRKAGEIGYGIVAYKVPEAIQADTYALSVLAAILANGKNSRLYRRLVDKTLTSAISAYSSFHCDPSLFQIVYLLTPGVPHETVEETIYATIDELVRYGVEDDELERVRKKLDAQMYFSRDGSYQLASQLNEAIAAGDWTFYTTWPEKMAAVTPQKVQDAAGRYLVRDKRTVGRFIPVTSSESAAEAA